MARNLKVAAPISFVLLVLLVAACAPAAAPAQSESLAVRAAPDEVVSAVALIAPRLHPPEGHSMPVILGLTRDSVSIRGEDHSYTTSQAVSQGISRALPTPSDPLARMFSSILSATASAAPPSGQYRVQVSTVAQPGGLTVVTIGSDTTFGGWLVESLARALESHFG